MKYRMKTGLSSEHRSKNSRSQTPSSRETSNRKLQRTGIVDLELEASLESRLGGIGKLGASAGATLQVFFWKKI
jgi:hypothetical protein